MRRQLKTPTAAIRRVQRSTAEPVTRRAYLLDTYPASTGQGSPADILVSLSDPTVGPRGVVMHCRVRAGTTTEAVAAGQPVLIKINHGKAELVSFG